MPDLGLCPLWVGPPAVLAFKASFSLEMTETEGASWGYSLISVGGRGGSLWLLGVIRKMIMVHLTFFKWLSGNHQKEERFSPCTHPLTTSPLPRPPPW